MPAIAVYHTVSSVGGCSAGAIRYHLQMNMFRETGRLLTIACVASLAACVSPSPETLAPTGGASLHYEDIDAFNGAMKAIEAGGSAATILNGYVERASPAMRIFVDRFGMSADSLAEKLTRFPIYYRYLASLRPDIESREPDIQAALAALVKSAPDGSSLVPVYFLIANMTAGGNPGVVETPEGQSVVIGIAIDVMAMSPRVDLTEFPTGGVGVRLTDIPFVVVHEMTHIFQMQLQGLGNYRSIYADRARATNLAFAIREGCADFLTWRASGWQLEERNTFVDQHLASLWTEFREIMHNPMDQQGVWFGPRSGSRPDLPLQVGYGLGMTICRSYYDAAPDKSAAMLEIYGAHLPEHFETIVAPFAAKMDRD
jgi:hypothetical protein